MPVKAALAMMGRIEQVYRLPMVRMMDDTFTVKADRYRGRLADNRTLMEKAHSQSSAEAPNLPLGWYATEIAGGGIDLRLSAPLRGRAAAVVAILAILTGGKALVQWNVRSTSVTAWAVLSLFLSGLALWIALGDEVWHLEQNCLVHRIGINGWCYSKRYQDAVLEIVVRFNKWGKPYYRLYATVNGKQRFLIERGDQELLMLARFISFHTGWRLRA